jgi:hypothetical protein
MATGFRRLRSHGISPTMPQKAFGNVGILRDDGDPARPWKLQQIDGLTTSHRLRWMDFDGSGRKLLVDPPLTGEKAVPPQYAGQTRLVYYRPGECKRRVISEENFGVQHRVLIAHWDPGDTRDSISDCELFRNRSVLVWRTTLEPDRNREGRPGAVPQMPIERHRNRPSRLRRFHSGH